MGFLDRLANVLGLKKKEANVLGTDIIQALSSNIFGYCLSVILLQYGTYLQNNVN
jgi:hypothetical protein